MFWISSLFVVFGLYRAVRDFLLSRSFVAIPLAGIFTWTIYITQTRALVLGLPSAIILCVPLQRVLSRGKQSVPTRAMVTTALLVSLTFVLATAATTNVASLLGLDRGSSDDGRSIQILPLLETWGDSPIVGNGFGSHAAYVRSNDAPFSYEMSILALYMKVGFAGAVLSSMYLVYLLSSFVPSIEVVRKRSKELSALFGAVYVLFRV